MSITTFGALGIGEYFKTSYTTYKKIYKFECGDNIHNCVCVESNTSWDVRRCFCFDDNEPVVRMECVLTFKEASDERS